MMFGKNNDSIISSSLTFKEILNDIRKCGRVYYLIGVTKDFNRKTTHAMAIVIDPYTKILELFDPNGISPDTQHVYFWSTQLINFLQQNNINVNRKITADEPFCPQGTSTFASNYQNEKQCTIWVYWYLWLRVNNPVVPAEVIRRYMSRLNPQEAFDRIRQIASIVYSS